MLVLCQIRIEPKSSLSVLPAARAPDDWGDPESIPVRHQDLAHPLPFPLIAAAMNLCFQLRRVHIAGISNQPSGAWMSQIVRNLTDCVDGFLRGTRHLILDRDPLYTRALHSTLAEAGVNVVRLPARICSRSTSSTTTASGTTKGSATSSSNPSRRTPTPVKASSDAGRGLGGC